MSKLQGAQEPATPLIDDRAGNPTVENLATGTLIMTTVNLEISTLRPSSPGA